MKLANALILSSAIAVSQANANINPYHKIEAYSPEITRHTSVFETSIDEIINELDYLKRNCEITWRKNKEDKKWRHSIESFSCNEEWNWDIVTEMINDWKAKYKWKVYSCLNLKTTITLNWKEQTVILKWQWAILEDKKWSLLMYESCSEIKDLNK